MTKSHKTHPLAIILGTKCKRIQPLLPLHCVNSSCLLSTRGCKYSSEILHWLYICDANLPFHHIPEVLCCLETCSLCRLLDYSKLR